MLRRLIRTAVSVSIVAGAGLVAFLPMAPAHAAEAQRWAFIKADQPTSSFYEPINQARSVAGADRSSVNRFGVGIYRVRLAGVGGFGVPFVSAANQFGGHCQISDFGSTPFDEQVDVRCYLGTTLADSAFSLVYTEGTPPDSRSSGAYGYALADEPTTAVYTPATQFSSSGQPVTVVARPEPGNYYVRFTGTGFQTLGGNVQVTAFSLLPVRCAVAQWYPHVLGADAQIRCTAPVSGIGVDSPFTVAFAEQRSIIGSSLIGRFGYLFADSPGSIFYFPNLARNRSPGGDPGSGSPNTVTRLGVGRYEVGLIAPFASRPDTVQVGVAGFTSDYCTIVDWITNPFARPAVRVGVACYTTNGVPRDNFFTLSYFTTS